MPPPSQQQAELTRLLQDVQVRLSKAELQLHGLEEDFTRSQQSSGNYSTKEEMRLQLENLRLTIENLKTQTSDIIGRLGTLETTIVKKIEDISKQQQESQAASMKRIIFIQGTVLLGILSAVLGVVIPLLLHH